jgi:AAA domain, putative AbiEii toxin, Type IV TA system
LYAKKLSIYEFRCFGRATLDLQYPGRPLATALEMPNVNLIVGDNGGGKSSVLRAIALAALAPAMLESGFVPYRLVRRPGGKSALLKLICDLDPIELLKAPKGLATIELLARINLRGRGSLDRLHLDKTPRSPIERLIFDDYSPAFFVVGYGATRRTETGEFSESSARRSRGLRYLRVAGLFEDQVTLRPMEAWFGQLKSRARRAEALHKLSSVLPPQLGFDGTYDNDEQQYVFAYDGRETPFNALSDGYKAFVSWVGDLIGHLCTVAPDHTPIDGLSGIVLIDEIDLHLHPAWQRTIVPALAAAFPKIQFVMTTHSPLIANTLRKENIFVTETAEDGTATIKQIQESVHGRGADQLLLSSYFGLQSTLPPSLNLKNRTLFAKAAEGDGTAALAFLEQLSAPTHAGNEFVPAIRSALSAPPISSQKMASKKAPAAGIGAMKTAVRKKVPAKKKAPSKKKTSASKKTAAKRRATGKRPAKRKLKR